MYIFIILLAIFIAIVVLILVLRHKKLKELNIRANQGDKEAQYDLARKYQNKKPREATQYLEQAAKNGHAEAQYELGLKYKHGKRFEYDCIDKDFAQAAYWFGKAAEQGFAAAQYELGYSYKYGNGIQKDSVEAFKWFEKSANQGNANAQYELGVCNLKGDGIGENLNEAINWFKKAAMNAPSHANYAGVIGGIKGIDKYLSPDRADVIRDIGIELIKRDYRLRCDSVDHFEGAHYVRIRVFHGDEEVGEMQFGGEGAKTADLWWSKDSLYGMYHLTDRYKNNFKHMIYLEKARILIKSETHSSEAPPEWLKICGQKLRGFTINYPDWVNKYPEAREYVNVVFQDG